MPCGPVARRLSCFLGLTSSSKSSPLTSPGFDTLDTACAPCQRIGSGGGGTSSTPWGSFSRQNPFRGSGGSCPAGDCSLLETLGLAVGLGLSA